MCVCAACVAGNPNTTAGDSPPDYGRFVIPPVAYQQTPWLETPTAGFNPIFPWIDANVQHPMNDAGWHLGCCELKCEIEF